MNNAQIKIDPNGKVAVRSLSTDPSFDIFLNGSIKIGSNMRINNTGHLLPIYSSNSCYLGNSTFPFQYIYGNNIWYLVSLQGSDMRFKENIKKIDSPLSKLLKMNGFKYDLKFNNADSIKDPSEQARMESLLKNRMGFIAQEVKDIVPEAVVYEKETDRYYIDYNTILTIAVEALKEQQAEIDLMRSEIDILKNSPKDKSASIESENDIQNPSLKQNTPNPFTDNTKIEMYVPNTVNNAILTVYNLQGEQISQKNLKERGSFSVVIEGHTLKAGMLRQSNITIMRYGVA
jgi:hypothetical protein